MAMFNMDQMGTTPNIHKFKVVFVGDQAVGKTSLINRYAYDSFEATYQATIGIDFVSKQLSFGDQTVKLQLWDTAGQERFGSLIPSYIRDSKVAIVIYDVTNRKSFESTSRWIETVMNLRGENVIIVLVGNKVDVEEERKVPWEEGERRAKEKEILFIETSAKTGKNVKELFQQFINLLPITNEGGQPVAEKDKRNAVIRGNPEPHSPNPKCKC